MRINIERAKEIIKYVADYRSCIWDCYDEGRLANAMGFARDSNPYDKTHNNSRDWFRGWDSEITKPS